MGLKRVFLLQEEVDYEGTVVLGVHSTLEKAKAAAQLYMRRNRRWGDELCIYSLGVDYVPPRKEQTNIDQRPTPVWRKRRKWVL